MFFNGIVHGQMYCLNYNSKDGLPNDYVSTVNQDHAGYIWIGTASGLVMFDGINFIKKGWDGNGDLPKEVFVKEILFDQNQNIWVSTERNGIFHHNRISKQWTNFSSSKESNQQIASDEIYDIELYENRLYFGCANCGLSYINTNTLEQNAWDFNKNEPIRKYMKLPLNDTLLIASQNSIYYLGQPLTNRALDTIIYNYPDLNIFDLQVDIDNQLWIIDYDKGIFQYKKSTNKIEDKNPSTFGDQWKYKIISDSLNTKWLLLPNIGIARQNNNDEKWELFTAQPFDLDGLPKGYYTSIFEDQFSILWVTSSKGLTCIHPDYQGFKHIKNQLNYKDYLLDAKFNTQASKYVLSYASPEDRIKFFDKDFNLLKALNHIPDDKRINSLYKLITYENGYLALGDMLYFIDPKSETIAHAKLPNLPINISPRAAFRDENNIWIYTTGNQILQYSLKEKKITKTIKLTLFNEKQYPFYIINDMADFGDYIGLAAQSTFALISKSSGNIYLYSLDLKSKKLDLINTHPEKMSTIYQSVYLDNDEFLLLTKSEGLHKAHIDRSTMEIIVEHSLSPDQLYSPVELAIDSTGKIWIATDNGLAIATKELQLIKKITSTHGLKYSNLVQGLTLLNNKILLNGESGIVLANPEVLYKQNEITNVDIISANLSGQDLLTNKKTSFDHTENNLNISASIPKYGNRESLSYSYRLVNYINDWTNQNTKISTFHYEKLPPGSYTFEIKTVENESQSAINSLSFQISPPFWHKWWFITLCTGGVLLLLYLFYKIRVNRKLTTERLNTQMAELKNEAIRAQLNPHFIFNALNSIRSMILLDQKEESIAYLGHFSSMVRDVLTLSKEKHIPLSRELEFSEKYIQIEQLRFSQKFTYGINLDKNVDTYHIRVPAMLLQPFIENAIWHGLLHKDGEAKLTVDISIVNEMLVINIEDNGIGRQAANQIKSSKRSKTRKGFGEILSSQRIRTLGESAKVIFEDKVANGIPQGTIVTIKIPVIYE